MKDQLNELRWTYNNWMGSQEQIDDVQNEAKKGRAAFDDFQPTCKNILNELSVDCVSN